MISVASQSLTLALAELEALTPLSMSGSSAYFDADLAAAVVAPQVSSDFQSPDTLSADVAAVAASIEVAFAPLTDGTLVARVRAPLDLAVQICGLVRGSLDVQFRGPECLNDEPSPYDQGAQFEVDGDSAGETGSYFIHVPYVQGAEIEAQLSIQVAEGWLTGIWFLGAQEPTWALTDLVSAETVAMISADELNVIFVR